MRIIEKEIISITALLMKFVGCIMNEKLKKKENKNRKKKSINLNFESTIYYVILVEVSNYIISRTIKLNKLENKKEKSFNLTGEREAIYGHFGVCFNIICEVAFPTRN